MIQRSPTAFDASEVWLDQTGCRAGASGGLQEQLEDLRPVAGSGHQVVSSSVAWDVAWSYKQFQDVVWKTLWAWRIWPEETV